MDGVNRASCVVLTVLSLTALGTVLIGLPLPPLPDEGLLAHIFQLSVACSAPALLIYALTADWRHARRFVLRLAIPGAALVLAFAGLYYMEHLR